MKKNGEYSSEEKNWALASHLAAVHAGRGEKYRYPLALKLIR